MTNRKSVYIFILILILLFFTIYTFSRFSKSPREDIYSYQDYNIILISIDILRADHLGCYGYELKTSPNIDKLAKEGILFENFIVQSYLTPISQMSIFSSQYPPTKDVRSFISENKPPRETLPKLLKKGGYKTVAFSTSPEFITDFANRPSVFVPLFDDFQYTGFRNLPTDAFKWLQDNKDEKFFLWISIGSVHFPYGQNAPSEIKRKFDIIGYDGILKYKSLDWFDTLSRIYQNKLCTGNIRSCEWLELSEQDIGYIISSYDAGVYYADTYIGDLLDELKDLNIMDNTLVVLHGIHGEDLGEHGYFGHYDIYDTEVKTVLIIYSNDLSVKNKRISNQVRGVDIAPTILDMVGIALSNESQGKSLIPIIQGKENESLSAYITRTPLWEEVLFWIIRNDYLSFDFIDSLDNSTHADIAIRTNEWKLIYRQSREIEEKISWYGFISNKTIKRDEFELYDLEEDPYEQINVIGDYPDIAEELKKDLLLWEEKILQN